MDMVGCAAYNDRRNTVVTRNTSHEGPEPFLYFRCDQSTPVLGAENIMNHDVRVGMGHEYNLHLYHYTFNRPYRTKGLGVRARLPASELAGYHQSSLTGLEFNMNKVYD